MSDYQYPQEENMEEEYNQYNNQYEDMECEYQSEYPLDHAISQEKGYMVYQSQELIKRIYDENEQKCLISCLPSEWNLMLYSFCNFSEEQLYLVFDLEQTGKNMIRFDPNYLPKESIGLCLICCSQTKLISNACGHQFCLQCWANYIKTKHTDRSQYQLFPMCPWEECFYRTNLLLMKALWNHIPELQNFFEKLLCQNYAQKSDRVKLCTRQGCNKAIFLHYQLESVVTCDCGNRLCRLCGSDDHYPLSCGDLKVWNQILSNKQSQWINELVTQACPMCLTPIDKNGGCIHMTCKCKYQFCWICLKVWKGHNNFSECNSVRKEDHEKRLMEEQQKRKKNESQYSVRFQESKSQIERIQSIRKRNISINMKEVTDKLHECHILSNDIAKLKEIKDLIIQVLEFQKNGLIYIFFQLQNYRVLKMQMIPLTHHIDKLDDFLIQKIKIADSVVEMIKVNNVKVGSPEKEVIDIIKKEFFYGKEECLQTINQVKKMYNNLREGHFEQKTIC